MDVVSMFIQAVATMMMMIANSQMISSILMLKTDCAVPEPCVTSIKRCQTIMAMSDDINVYQILQHGVTDVHNTD